jgi:hypothetical protein
VDATLGHGVGNVVCESRLCVDCLELFPFTRGEATFYDMRGLQPPKRCPECRQARRLEREAGLRGPRDAAPAGGNRW